ncbi:MAG: hypothetical protein U0176_04010 [Bacteroidia bacterium]
MKKTLLILGSLLAAGVLVAFMMNDDEQRPKRGQDNRISVERVLEAFNLNFHKEIGQTSIIFQFAPEDSIKIECEDCLLRMANSEDKGGLAIKLQSIDKTEVLKPSAFGQWLRINSSNGKVGLVFERDGVGEKVLSIRSLKVLRKTRSPFLDEGGVPMGLLDVNNLYIDKLTKDNTEIQTRFLFKLKSDDKIKVDIIGSNGAVPANLICSVYKTGEEYDKKPMATGVELNVPPIDGGQDLFGFEFAHIKDVKGVNAYHLDIYRIPLNTAGYRDIRDTIVPDTIRGDCTYMVAKEGFYEGPDFVFLGPEGTIKANVPGRFNLGINKNFRACYDIPLSDEGLPAEACKGCDTFWAFWMGVGNANINRYLYQDSLRKMASKGGLVEAFARSMKTRGNSLGVFPPPQQGEKAFFAIVNATDKQRFLTSEFNDANYDGNDTTTWSSQGLVPTKQFRLHYTPGSALSLCVCNNSSVNTVPVMFKFQQFVTAPKAKDSLEKVIPNAGSLFEVLPTEVQ